MMHAFLSRALRFLAFVLAFAVLSTACASFGGKVSAAQALTLTLTRTNSWEESGKTRSQFAAAIKNGGTDPVSGWKIAITVPEGTSMGSGDGWNGIFSISGTILTITPKDYNKEIQAGSETSDIGFILTTLKPVELTGVVTVSDNAASLAADASASALEPDSSALSSKPAESGSGSQQGTTDTGTSGSQPVNAAQAPTQDDWLHTDGNKILDENGTAVWLTGINWFGYNTGTNVFDGVWACNMQSALASIADRGFNLLRIPISAELVLNWKNGVYPAANFNQASNPELVGMNSLEIFDLAIAACKANGMKVMLDIHSAKTDSMGHLTNLWYTDSISTQDYYDSLTFLAQRFADDDTVVAYDLKNEPHGKPGEESAVWNDSTSGNNWKYVAETAGNLVLDANPHVLIMIEGVEIYPRDMAENGDFSSTDSADYYFNWWGGNLRGVRNYPIDFGSEARNSQIVYSPHDYGPAVFAQPWFEGGFSYESLQTDCWNDNWLYISKENIAPLLIGEWGGFMTEPNLTWMTYLRRLIAENHLNHTFWCFNANSGDTGGLVKDDFTTWDEEKYEFVKEVLWQQDGKFVGLDHVIALGQSGHGLPLSAVSGPAAASGSTSGNTSQLTPGAAASPAAAASPSSPAPQDDTGSLKNDNTQQDPSALTSVMASESGAASDESAAGWSVMDSVLAGAAMIFVLAGSVVTAYVTYTSNKKKGEDKK